MAYGSSRSKGPARQPWLPRYFRLRDAPPYLGMDRNRFNVVVMMLFAFGGVLLAAAGIHSVVGESVAVRAKEMAVKTALGASRGLLLREAIWKVLLFVALGELAGVAMALVLGRVASDLLYLVSPGDPFLLFCIFVFVLVTSAIASLVPAWFATGKDPIGSLQAD